MSKNPQRSFFLHSIPFKFSLYVESILPNLPTIGLFACFFLISITWERKETIFSNQYLHPLMSTVHPKSVFHQKLQVTQVYTSPPTYRPPPTWGFVLKNNKNKNGEFGPCNKHLVLAFKVPSATVSTCDFRQIFGSEKLMVN